MIQIRGIPISPSEASSITSYDMLHRQGYLLYVKFYPPKADIVFLFKSRKDRDEIYNNIQAQQEAE